MCTPKLKRELPKQFLRPQKKPTQERTSTRKHVHTHPNPLYAITPTATIDQTHGSLCPEGQTLSSPRPQHVLQNGAGVRRRGPVGRGGEGGEDGEGGGGGARGGGHQEVGAGRSGRGTHGDGHGDVARRGEGVEGRLVAVLDVVALLGFPGHLLSWQAHRGGGRRGLHLQELHKQLRE